MLTPAILGPVGGLLGGVFDAISGVVLGGLNWTVGVAGKFILATLAGLVRLIIPASWARQGLEVMHWIVAVPDYAGTVTSPGGHTTYGFAGINSLRDLFMWTGAALLPLTLVYATSRATLGLGGHVVAPVGRVLGLAAVLVSYPWWWSEAAAAINQVTHFVLGLPAVSHGLDKLMQYAVGGVALGGWQLVDLFLMGAIGVALLGLIFLKVVIVLLGALVYAVGPLMIGLVPTEGGAAVARAWASAASLLLALPLVWSTVLAVGALLVNDSATAGPLIAGSSTIAHLLGGLMLALAGLASLWLCIRAAREAGGVLRGQLAGVLAFGAARRVATASVAPPQAQRAAESLRGFPGRVTRATGAALGAAGPAGQGIAAGAAGLATYSRRGLIGTGGAVVRAGVLAAAPGTAALVGRTRAGAAAVRMARAGSASWQQSNAGAGTARQAHVSSFRSSTAPRANADEGTHSGGAPTGAVDAAGGAGHRQPAAVPPPSAPAATPPVGGDAAPGRAGAPATRTSARSSVVDGRDSDRSSSTGSANQPAPARHEDVLRPPRTREPRGGRGGDS
jgi:hypothetical protein